MRYIAGFVFALLVMFTWGYWEQRVANDAGSRFETRTTTTAYVFGTLPYLVHDESGTHADWRGLLLGGSFTVMISLVLLRIVRKRPTQSRNGDA